VSTSKSYWFYTLLTIALAIVFFAIFKQYLPKQLFPETTVDEENIVVDEWMQQAIKEDSLADTTSDTIHTKSAAEIIADASNKRKAKDSVLVEDNVAVEENRTVDDLNLSIEEASNEIDDAVFLNHFYKSLLQIQKAPNSKQVRIAYFGDSMTDGDMIVQDLRELFQDKFGGAGVGFVPITSESATSRGSIHHRFSNNWEEYVYFKTYDTIYPFGVSGQVFYQNDTINPTTLHFATGLYAKGAPLEKPVLYYGKSDNQAGKIKISTPSDTTELLLKSNRILNTLALSNRRRKKIDLEFINADSIPFYGVDFSSSYGIQVDNFSKRGNSGLPITQLDTQLMHAFQNALKYDLIILHYGTNVLNTNSFNYRWYQSRMQRVVDHLRNAFPNTSILVVSIADKATKYETAMQTDSAVTHLLASQRAYATKKKTGFVNLFTLMGGDGSMIEWVEEEPVRANKDYTHFNHQGAKQIAQIIYQQIDNGFEKYVKKKEEIDAERERIRVQDSIRKAEEERIRQQKLEQEQRIKQDSTHVLQN